MYDENAFPFLCDADTLTQNAEDIMTPVLHVLYDTIVNITTASFSKVIH